MTLDRLCVRRNLLDQFDDEVRRIDRSHGVETFNRQQWRAFEILTNSAVKSAFDLDVEDPKTMYQSTAAARFPVKCCKNNFSRLCLAAQTSTNSGHSSKL